ncbi:sulfite exporter TauE/SafE family protein [Sansalvadorimonas sp. 2012CJ34-2]|uniref:Probable membrane transporter protein n=1 Tax=Parendozoicomonas callyspongiae TaxID=2942213 RepID=A0ABT0PJN6_9GAMM|nr:sulfite exporter TauE/SafE family protein [Sansalvadorimonas sp. 2012CJ34-2]MCL6271607.1 sulfite exporter TauE/SafE family protein [Sansalvadorimonas sp. 2012CJ34-2]
MYELTLVNGLILVGAGIAAGFINTIAGGGSMLTLPALMLMGMPADIANATNRVGVVMQSVAGLQGFHKHKRLDTSAMMAIVLPTLLGAAAGAILASWLPADILKPVLLGTMIVMALVMVIKPSALSPKEGTQSLSFSEKPSAWLGLFFAGAYGGFLQAGVGFMLLAAIAGGLRYDLVRANALKVFCTFAFSLVALGIFIYNDLVLWIPGLILALGSMIGARLSVNFTVKASMRTLEWILFAMIVLVCVAALFN